MSATWMIVERYENWLADKKEGFLTFGLTERRGKQAQLMQVGDLVVVYVSSNISAFSDIRQVRRIPVTPFPASFAKYGAPFLYKVETTSVLELLEEQWVPIRGLLEQLTFTMGRENWSPVMQMSLRRLVEPDATLLVKAMTSVAGGDHRELLSSLGKTQRQ